MRATLFEFRHRWWFIFAIFFVAFTLYNVDQQNSAVTLTEWVARELNTRATVNSYRLIFACGAALVALAALLRTWGTSYLQAEVMRDSRVHTEKVLADGPYRHVRNPLYLGNILMAMGIGLMASRIGFFVLVVGMMVFVLRLILREESELVRDQGETYRRYYAAVPRLIPSPAPRVPPAGNRPHWRQGMIAELMYWLFALAEAAFALTLNIVVFYAFFVFGIAASILTKRKWGNRPPESKV